MLSTKGLSIKPIIHSQSTIKSNFGKPEVISKWTFQIIVHILFVSTISLHFQLPLKMIWHWLYSSTSEITFIKHYFYPFLRLKAIMVMSAIISYRTVFPPLMNLTLLCLQFPYILSWVPNCNLSCELSNSHLLSHFTTTIWISRVTQAPWILLSNPLNQGINLVPEMT